MEVVGLVSGGKDSCYNLMCAVKEGHKLVAIANLHPPTGQGEMDSYMYQSVGCDGVEVYGEALGVPLYRREISGKPLNQEVSHGVECTVRGYGADQIEMDRRNNARRYYKEYDYVRTDGDEVEDLYELLVEVKRHHPNVKGVSAGAILSSYQKLRVEDICRRLDLVPLCYLWEREQRELLQNMIDDGVDAILIKVAAMGLGAKHLGKTLTEMQPALLSLSDKYGVHPCGEGGEYESFVRDCPLFKKRIVVQETEVVTHSADDMAPVCYLLLNKLVLEEK